MRSRIGCPILSNAVAAAACVFLCAGSAHAHRLEADYRLLPNHAIQIECWFDLSGESPRGAMVQVFRADGEVFVEGKLDERGVYLFTCEEPGPLRVVILAGGGHRKEMEISAADLRRAAGTDSALAEQNTPSDAPGLFADRGSRVTLKDVLTGIALLVAVAAFALSLRNARALRQLRGENGFPR
jgi:hypothetical protein